MSGRLAGRRILVTRAVGQAASLISELDTEGATTVAVALIATRPVATPAAIRAAVARATDVVVTSANAVRYLLEAGASFPPEMRVWAVGPRTAAALRRVGGTAQPLAGEYAATAMADRFVAAGPTGRRVLLAQAENADPGLERRLSAAGERVENCVIYRTATVAEAADPLRAALREGVDAITFLSGSAVLAANSLVGKEAVGSALVACIGDATAAVAAGLGIRVGVVAEVHTGAGLVAALSDHFDPGGADPTLL